MKRILSHEEIPEQVKIRTAAWQQKRKDFDPGRHAGALSLIFSRIVACPDAEWDPHRTLRSILGEVPKDGVGFYSKSNLVAGYRYLVEAGDLDPDPQLLKTHSHEAHAHSQWCGPRDRVDGTRRVPGGLHILSR